MPAKPFRHLPALIRLSALASAWSPLVAHAQSTASEAPGAPSGAILQMLTGLAVIIGILFICAYVIRQLNGGRQFGQTAGPMKTIGVLAISPRERILLVEIGDTWLVVGVVPGQIKTLYTLPKGEIPASIAQEAPFGRWLKHFTEKQHAP